MAPLFVTSPTKPLLSTPFLSTPFFLPSIFYTSSSDARYDIIILASCKDLLYPLLPSPSYHFHSISTSTPPSMAGLNRHANIYAIAKTMPIVTAVV
jgi:hypothetical protein